MQIITKPLDEITLVEIRGDIDGRTAPSAQEQILPLIKDGCKVILDMGQVGYMASAGLRMLLSVRRQTPSNGTVILMGLSEEIAETMSMTGFLDFFTVANSLEEAKQAALTK